MKEIIEFIKHDIAKHIQIDLLIETLDRIINGEDGLYCTKEYLEAIFKRNGYKQHFSQFSDFILFLESKNIIGYDKRCSKESLYKIICFSVDEYKLFQMYRMANF